MLCFTHSETPGWWTCPKGLQVGSSSVRSPVDTCLSPGRYSHLKPGTVRPSSPASPSWHRSSSCSLFAFCLYLVQVLSLVPVIYISLSGPLRIPHFYAESWNYVPCGQNIMVCSGFRFQMTRLRITAPGNLLWTEQWGNNILDQFLCVCFLFFSSDKMSVFECPLQESRTMLFC